MSLFSVYFHFQPTRSSDRLYSCLRCLSGSNDVLVTLQQCIFRLNIIIALHASPQLTPLCILKGRQPELHIHVSFSYFAISAIRSYIPQISISRSVCMLPPLLHELLQITLKTCNRAHRSVEGPTKQQGGLTHCMRNQWSD